MSKVGSCAAGACEPGQVRKEAALSGHSWVPQGSLAGELLGYRRPEHNFHLGSHFAGGLWSLSTLAAYRGQGLYTALLAARAQESIQRGIRFLTVDASPMSRPILEKLGFQWLSTFYPRKWQPQKSGHAPG